LKAEESLVRQALSFSHEKVKLLGSAPRNALHDEERRFGLADLSITAVSRLSGKLIRFAQLLEDRGGAQCLKKYQRSVCI